MDKEITARRLNMALTENNMSQQTLSDLSGVSKASISQYIHGRNIPNSESASNMARVLGVRPEWLMGFGDDDINKYFDPTYRQINELWEFLSFEQRQTIVQTARMFANLKEGD